MTDPPSKLAVIFIASARDDLIAFPEKVRRQLGRVLNRVQQGETPLKCEAADRTP